MISQLKSALETFRKACLPRMAREIIYSGWIAHFLMMKCGIRNVLIESHHDGRALSSAMYKLLKETEKSWLANPDGGRGGAFSFDIAVTRSETMNVRTFQYRFPDYKTVTMRKRRSVEAEHLLKFSLIIEVKLVDNASQLRQPLIINYLVL